MHSCLTVPDIVDQIVDVLSEDVAMMRRCSLVSRIWTYRTRKHIFKEVHLRVARPSPWDGDLALTQRSYRPEQLLSIMQASPHLINMVNTLHVVQYDRDTSSRAKDFRDGLSATSVDWSLIPIRSVFSDPATTTLLSMFPSLRTIRLRQSSFSLDDEKVVFDNLAMAFRRNQLPELARFEFYGCGSVFNNGEDFLRRISPFIQEIVFSDAHFLDHESEEEPMASPILFPQLKELRIEGSFQHEPGTLIHHCNSFRSPVLRKFSAGLFPESSSEVKKMIRSISGTLEYLWLECLFAWDEKIDAPDIWACKSLRVLYLANRRSPSNSVAPWVNNCLSVALNTLCDHGCQLPLETISTRVLLFNPLPKTETPLPNWELFDHVISGFHLRAGNLKRVHLSMFQHNNTPSFEEAHIFITERLPRTVACQRTGLELVIDDRAGRHGYMSPEVLELWES